MGAVPRPPFSASPLSADSPNALPSSSGPWQPILSSTATFSPESFTSATEHLVLHPEYNSSVILRADVLLDSTDGDGGDEDRDSAAALEGYTFVRRVRRRLLPNRTKDAAMEEECRFYEDADGARLLVLRADVEPLAERPLPYYYPHVASIAFRYLPDGDAANVRIDYIALPDAPLPEPLPLDHRLYRTALGLLRQLCQVSSGLETGYTKRVHHDLLADRAAVQDLYLVLKEKYRCVSRLRTPLNEGLIGVDRRADIPLHSPRITFSWMLNEWKVRLSCVCEASPVLTQDWPGKHGPAEAPVGGCCDCELAHHALAVDVPRYGPASRRVRRRRLRQRPSVRLFHPIVRCCTETEPCRVFILSSEGYPGYGVDLRARKSWPAYSNSPDLRVQTLDPVQLLSSATPPFPPSSFLIGNHSDELTPWLPLFAASVPNSAFLSIPCCLHSLSGRFTHSEYIIPPEFLAALPPTPSTPLKNAHPLLIPFYAPAPNEQGGRYLAYQLYLAHLALLCGFVPEREALRIPSTKNFGMLGRTRVWGAEGREAGEKVVAQRVREMVESVKGLWVARTPEGKAGAEHE